MRRPPPDLIYTLLDKTSDGWIYAAPNQVPHARPAQIVKELGRTLLAILCV